MSDPLNDKIVAALDEQFGSPGALWDVLQPSFQSGLGSVCGVYPSATVAWAFISEAGFKPTGDGFAVPPMDYTHDLQTVMRFKDETGLGLILARRKRS